MQLTRLNIPTTVLAVVALVVAVGGGATAASLITGDDVKNNSLTSADIKDGTLKTDDIKQGGVSGNRLKGESTSGNKLQKGTVSGDRLKDGAVTSAKIKDGTIGAQDLAPGAVSFPQTLWGPSIRNQIGAGQSSLAAGPGTPPMGSGSLHLSVTGAGDRAAFGDPIDFAGIELDSITDLSYASYNPDAVPAVRPSLRFEINPHLADDSTAGGVFEFSTLTYEPSPGASGWVTHANIQDDHNWYLSGDAGTATGCVNTVQGLCTLTEVKDRLNANADPDTAQPAISSGVYFALGSGIAATTGAVDKFVFNNFTFDFEPSGVFLTTS